MAKKNCELMVLDPISLAQAEKLLAGLWLGVSEGLDAEVKSIEVSGLYAESLREANTAVSLVGDWESLSKKAVENPGGLTLRGYGLTRTRKLVETNLKDGDGEQVILDTKYSVLSAVFDCKGKDYRFGTQPETGTPQLELTLTELYSDSLREARSAMSGTLCSQADVGLTKSPERKCGKVDGLEGEAFLIGQIASRQLSLLGKTTWYDPHSHSIRTWDLAGIKLKEAVSTDVCPFEVRRRMRFGRLDDQTNLHPAAFQHDFLAETAPALFSAVEPLAQMVVRNIEKSKR